MQNPNKFNINSNVGKKWTPEESDQLLKLYTEGLDVNQIATIHGRKAGGIATRLVMLKVVDDVSNVRGYSASDEYKQKLNNSVKGIASPSATSPLVCKECESLKEMIKELERENAGLRSDISAINKTLAAVTELL